MKKCLLFILFCFSTLIASCQVQYAILNQPICWSVGDVDSTLTRFIYMTPDLTSIEEVLVVNADGTTVTISGGTLASGYCCCSGGGSGAMTQVEASNGLNNQGTPTNADIELGGTLERVTTIDIDAFDIAFKKGTDNILKIENAGGITDQGRVEIINQSNFFEDTEVHFNAEDISGTKSVDMELDPDNILHQFRVLAQDGDFFTQVRLRPDNSSLSATDNTTGETSEFLVLATTGGAQINYDASGGGSKEGQIRVENGALYFVINGIQTMSVRSGNITFDQVSQYASNAAADADGTLPSGGIYQITGDRTIYRKP